MELSPEPKNGTVQRKRRILVWLMFLPTILGLVVWGLPILLHREPPGWRSINWGPFVAAALWTAGCAFEFIRTSPTDKSTGRHIVFAVLLWMGMMVLNWFLLLGLVFAACVWGIGK